MEIPCTKPWVTSGQKDKGLFHLLNSHQIQSRALHVVNPLEVVLFCVFVVQWQLGWHLGGWWWGRDGVQAFLETLASILWGTLSSVGNVAQPPLGKASGEQGSAGPWIGSPVGNQAYIVPRLLWDLLLLILPHPELRQQLFTKASLTS